MFDLKRGDLSRLSEKSGVPINTVRRYAVLGLSIGKTAADKVDAAYKSIKPVRSKKQAVKHTSKAAQSKRAKSGRVPAGSQSVKAARIPASAKAEASPK